MCLKSHAQDAKEVFDLSLPTCDDVQVEVVDSQGQVVWRLNADGLEPGAHRVVWDNFVSPGLHSVYARGMGWDAERRVMVTDPRRGCPRRGSRPRTR